MQISLEPRHNINTSDMSEINFGSSVTQIMSFGDPEYATNATDSERPAEDPFQKYIDLCKKQNIEIDDFILQENSKSA